VIEQLNRSWYWETAEPLLHGLAALRLEGSLSKAWGAFNHQAQLVVIFDWMQWSG
jgi:hypothetical protein